MHRTINLLITLLILLSCTLPANAQTGTAVVEDLVTLFSGWSGDDDDHSIYEPAARHIDYQEMAETSVGQAQWNKLNATQKREFVSALRHLIENRYYPRWHHIFHKGKLTIVSETTTRNELWVKTLLSIGKKQSYVTWRLRRNDSGEPMVVSLTVGEKDLLTRMTVRFQKQIAKSGIEGLIAWLKDKLDIDPNEAINSTAMSLI
ncbi:MAG: ABC transporter substrate-binding protein [Candidatus Obscuribacterales bacterium]|nr:ABC transporter substrate-binding protein [Candidatus Obscuribacterales bacterium]